MRTIQVRHRNGNYPVMVGTGIGSQQLVPHLAQFHPTARVAVISDANVAAALAPPLDDAARFVFPAGERHKSRDTWADLTDQLLSSGHGRDTVVIAHGGGVTTDLAGFVAATFLRGVPWIAMPTTTLAMIDAAIGGKTGVDTDAGKNLVGSFHPPSAVIADTSELHTLPERIFREGLAEAVKHAAILDAPYGEWIMANADAILTRDDQTMAQLVTRSAELKAGVVSGDEHEGGVRAILNAGHTVAHAIERVSNFEVPHGEAVAMGLVTETRLAESMSICAAGTARRIAELCQRLGLPVDVPGSISRRAMEEAMAFDKKNRDGLVHAALLSEFGAISHASDRWTTPIDPSALLL